MTYVELRKQLIDKINKTENLELLEEANRLLGVEINNNVIFEFYNYQKERINESLTQIKKGDFLTEIEANKEIDEWLEK
ncbi:hypothetical protein A5893_10260 [Pedobacter psychrophilus]|uniref:Uncharacterized protein n=1 Tax=Pedobacter psychrophilus TaxID=1826909 RepID=A0A179DE15_9SPHI|nr:hypothetical protein [Pedobacter psychrophilus]OAQ39052.1 hypothetical protein A5893_10260 [Pedobacter psychrophilus]